MSGDRSAPILAWLLNRAKARGEDYDLVLNRFVLERPLYRLSISPQAGNFLLKGALLFSLWQDMPHRPTCDADLLGVGPNDADTPQTVFGEICAIDADEGVRFDAGTIAVAAIREDNCYGGLLN